MVMWSSLFLPHSTLLPAKPPGSGDILMNGYSLVMLRFDEYIYIQYMYRNCIDCICLHMFINIHELCYFAYNHITHTYIVYICINKTICPIRNHNSYDDVIRSHCT